MEGLYLTEKQKKRVERNERICKEYLFVRQLEPNASRNRIIKKIGDEYELDAMTIKGILVRKGIYDIALKD